jgi:hypothetical protein
MDDEKLHHDEDEVGPSVAEGEPYEFQDEEEAAAEHRRLNADLLLDKVIPNEIDWRDLVRRHPMLSVGVAAGLGFLIGRSKGAAIVAGVSAAVTTGVMRQLSDVLDGEIFEF